MRRSLLCVLPIIVFVVFISFCWVGMVNYRRGDFFFGLYGFHSLNFFCFFFGWFLHGDVSHTRCLRGNEKTWLGLYESCSCFFAFVFRDGMRGWRGEILQ